jgi:hypothetical protein
MTYLLKTFDELTSNTSVSICTTISITSYSLYKAYSYRKHINYLPIAISACAGSAIALLANSYIAHNAGVKTEGQRKTVYSKLSIIVGCTELLKTYIFSRIYYCVYRLFDNLGVHINPMEFLWGLTNGFLVTNLINQLNDAYKTPVNS